MFDIGWSELLVIGVVALIAIGPKELPGVLRMVGQWMGKARRMAAEFQGQFQEAMREAEMADLKKSFDEVREAASGFSPTGVISSLQRDVDKALDIEGVDKPAEVASPAPESTGAATEAPAIPTTPEPPHPETFVEAQSHQAADEPLAIVREIKPEPKPEPRSESKSEFKSEAGAETITSEEADRFKDAKAS
ncbi:putative sec-independent protein secretion pathway component TatB [Bradyrhizobium sp. STM 3843]|uniref:Sec-independent protein translocase protein TatB n=1 Tax=Bradyrhizobium sp. STM 3843 TaxID=551947 RepID=UPI000240A4E8|nr:Sec-independent protein translocase protein TatB [Bradyrhizobium sp. STM 3843]CCE06014.1 putative sec-independent protein secretion pathway component TatB [Bradyrhizobium sp. STM 3843]